MSAEPLAICWWHLVMAETGREIDVVRDLWKRGFEAYVPAEVVWVGAHQKRQQALFPGYLFVLLELGQPQHLIEDRPGVIRFVRFGQDAAVVGGDLVDKLRTAETLGAFDRTLGKVVRRARFRKGQAVRFNGGAWQGLSAIVDVPGPDRVRVLLDMLGRATCIVAPEAVLEPA